MAGAFICPVTIKSLFTHFMHISHAKGRTGLPKGTNQNNKSNSLTVQHLSMGQLYVICQYQMVPLAMPPSTCKSVREIFHRKMREPESEISYLSRQETRSSRRSNGWIHSEPIFQSALSDGRLCQLRSCVQSANHQTLFGSPDEEVARLGVSHRSLMASGCGVSRVF